MPTSSERKLTVSSDIIHDFANKLVIIGGFLELISIRSNAGQMTQEWLDGTLSKLKDATDAASNAIRKVYQVKEESKEGSTGKIAQ